LLGFGVAGSLPQARIVVRRFCNPVFFALYKLLQAVRVIVFWSNGDYASDA
jgi:hypothetical protein